MQDLREAAERERDRVMGDPVRSAGSQGITALARGTMRSTSGRLLLAFRGHRSERHPPTGEQADRRVRTSLAPLILHRAATPLREERSNDQSSN